MRRSLMVGLFAASIAPAVLASGAGMNASLWPIVQEATADAAPPPATVGSTGVSDRATFLFSDNRFHSDPTIGWEGFIKGLRGFEHFYNPVGNPLYFETPFNNTGVRFLYLHHEFPDDSQLQGGDLDVYAMQARIALTDRLAFIATKDGFSDLDAEILPEDQGWNDIAVGLKYLFWIDRENDFVSTLGVRWMLDNGDDGILQSGNNEFSPFISAAKGFDRFHLIGNLTGRIPIDDDDGNHIIQWDLHADYEIWPEVLKGFAPMFEVHGLHYVSDGERFPLSVGGLDYTNLGSSDVEGSTVVWGEWGARWKFSPNFSVGATYGYPFTNRDADIMGERVTVDFEITW